jgi:TATA-box binding protein (TBP) (component of TFIID and TFIIIB)
MNSHRAQVFNVKAHFETTEKNLISNPIKKYRNFDIISIESNKYIVFDKSNIVSVTGVKKFKDISNAALIFCKRFNKSLVPQSIKIDNSTACDFFPNINRKLLTLIALKKSDCHQLFSISARTKHFPCILLRPHPSGKEQKLATAAIFTSGKVNILGARNRKVITNTIAESKNLLKKYGWMESGEYV